MSLLILLIKSKRRLRKSEKLRKILKFMKTCKSNNLKRKDIVGVVEMLINMVTIQNNLINVHDVFALVAKQPLWNVNVLRLMEHLLLDATKTGMNIHIIKDM